MKLSLPATITVVILGAGTAGCGPAPSPNPDGGPLVCPRGCFTLKEADGGYVRTEDGGVQCLC